MGVLLRARRIQDLSGFVMSVNCSRENMPKRGVTVHPHSGERNQNY